MSAESFLDRFSLPRIARLIAPKAFYDDQQKQQSHSNSILGKSKKLSTVNQYLHQHPINSIQQQHQQLTTMATNNINDTNCSDDIKADNNNNGELFLLYRHLKKYKVYHAVNAKSGTNRKKGIKIPQDFTGKCQESVIIHTHTRTWLCNINVSWLCNCSLAIALVIATLTHANTRQRRCWKTRFFSPISPMGDSSMINSGAWA